MFLLDVKPSIDFIHSGQNYQIEEIDVSYFLTLWSFARSSPPIAYGIFCRRP